MQNDTKSCNTCRKHSKYVCGSCKTVSYCSDYCQKKDWRCHSKTCFFKKNKTHEKNGEKSKESKELNKEEIKIQKDKLELEEKKLKLEKEKLEFKKEKLKLEEMEIALIERKSSLAKQGLLFKDYVDFNEFHKMDTVDDFFI